MSALTELTIAEARDRLREGEITAEDLGEACLAEIDAAGAFASPEIARRAAEAGLDAARFLAENDSFRFFDGIGELLRTGPTNTNVCDIQVALVDEP